MCERLPAMNGKQTHRVILMFSRNNKADRDRLSGTLRYASAREDWDVHILDCSSPETLREASELTASWRTDAVIYSERHRLPDVLRERIRSAACLAAEIDAQPAEGHAAVSVQLNGSDVTDAAYHLLRRRGFAHLAYFGTHAPDERAYSADWEQRFARLAADAESFHVFRMRQNLSWAQSLQQAGEWVRALPKPCGVMSYSDELSRDLLDACRLTHVLVPEQLAIIGVDNALDVCETARPALSSILPDFELSGYLAAEAVDAILRRKRQPKRPKRLSYGIKGVFERASTQDLSGCGRIASQANEIIQRDFRSPLTVAEIARRINVSTRLLELHFKKVFGHSVKQEITRWRVEELRHLLTTGKRPICEIASACGFASANTAQIAFRKHFGHAMRDVRADAVRT